jgi:hypothetical protein
VLRRLREGIGDICVVCVRDRASEVNVQAKESFILNVLFINVYMNFVRIIMVISGSIGFRFNQRIQG